MVQSYQWSEQIWTRNCIPRNVIKTNTLCPSFFSSCLAKLPLLNNTYIMHCKQHWGYAVHTPAPRDGDREAEPWTRSLSLTLHTINQLHDALLTCKALIKHDDLRFAMASPHFPWTAWPTALSSRSACLPTFCSFRVFTPEFSPDCARSCES